MDSHIKGPVTGQHNGAIVSQRGFIATTTKTKVATIEASAKEPVLIEFLGTAASGTVSSDHGGGNVVRAATGWSTPIELVARTDIYAVASAGGRLYMRATGVGNGVPI